MVRSASLMIISALLLSCQNQIPKHEDLVQASTRSELRDKFGEPNTIWGGRYMPDVIKLFSDPAPFYKEYEDWVYISTKDGEVGATYLSFYLAEEEALEYLHSRSWITEDVQRRLSKARRLVIETPNN